MTFQEKELLERFLQQMTAARAGQKDPEAEALIKEAVARQPDAPYLLVQRAVQLEQALQATQAQMQKLQAELDQSRPASRGGFLNDPAWGSQPTAPATQNATPMRQAAGAPNATAAAPTPPAPGGAWGGGGMLGNIATTAAGVVAGSFLFQGIDRLMHHGDTGLGSGRDQSAQSGLLDNDTANVYDHDSPPVDTALDDNVDSFADCGDSSEFA
ncbi:MAG TPA: DUF2076 family protein [Burkholderiales bacterium]|nr:DUF2076 family protein [Burkholderiales bacterium]